MKAVLVLIVNGEEKARKVWDNYSDAHLHAETVIQDMAEYGCRFHQVEGEATRWVEIMREDMKAELLIGMALF